MCNPDMTIEQGSTNVFADLGYADAAEMQRRSSLAAKIANSIKSQRLSQAEAAVLLEIEQIKLSQITRGMFRNVSEQQMLELLTKLGHDVRIVIGPIKRHSAPGKIQLEFA